MTIRSILAKLHDLLFDRLAQRAVEGRPMIFDEYDGGDTTFAPLPNYGAFDEEHELGRLEDDGGPARPADVRS